jgi:hypothetical protein
VLPRRLRPNEKVLAAAWPPGKEPAGAPNGGYTVVAARHVTETCTERRRAQAPAPAARRQLQTVVRCRWS